jgi:hypothetical protein
MSISITRADVVSILPKVEVGLKKYMCLQARIADGRDFHTDPECRRRFNGFYRVRRGAAWQDVFYGLMAPASGWPFSQVLEELSSATGRLEVSFASKLVASLDPSSPVIDSIVLKQVGLKLPAPGTSNRGRRACEVYEGLCHHHAELLRSDMGRELVHLFRSRYPWADITELKMVDLVLWQNRGG